jgi:zinc protease
MRSLIAAAAAVLLMGAAPPDPTAHFPAAVARTLPNGVIVTAQISNDAPIAGAQIFLPAGLAQQSADQAGVAAVTADTVLHTPVENGQHLADLAAAAGGSISYTVDPEATRFEVQSSSAELPRLVRDLAQAIMKPDPSQFAAARAEVVAAARDAEKIPALVAYSMVRQVRYQGTGFAYPQGGRAFTLAKLTPADSQRFAAGYQHGTGTVVALAGALSDADIDAVARAFATWPAGAAAPAPSASPEKRQHEIVAYRNVSSPWLAIAFEAPSQYSKDFATMLVIQALLGRGGDVHAMSFGSAGSGGAEDYVGNFYQYEARPGSFVIFLNQSSDNGNIAAAAREIEEGIVRMRTEPLPEQIIARARSLALGDYFLSVTSLGDAAWLLGRSASSPEGVAFENALAGRILAVSAADIQRVAKQYLGDSTIAVVQPVSAGR